MRLQPGGLWCFSAVTNGLASDVVSAPSCSFVSPELMFAGEKVHQQNVRRSEKGLTSLADHSYTISA